jgi:hypothetical protein
MRESYPGSSSPTLSQNLARVDVLYCRGRCLSVLQGTVSFSRAVCWQHTPLPWTSGPSLSICRSFWCRYGNHSTARHIAAIRTPRLSPYRHLADTLALTEVHNTIVSMQQSTCLHVFRPDHFTLHMLPGAWGLSLHAAMQMSVPQVRIGWSGDLLELRPGTTGTHLCSARPGGKEETGDSKTGLCADWHGCVAVACM